MSLYQQVIYKTRYSRWLESENRREHWEETVGRVVGFWRERNPEIPSEVYDELFDRILSLQVMPSMRAMWSAGPALAQNNFRGYNCSFVAADHPRVFDEILFILMAGTGVGFSAEAKYVEKLPIINDHFTKTERVITIADSAEGWARALRKLIADLYLGYEHQWDFSKIRPEGARLKTMGGRASGPEPLKELFIYATTVFKSARGRKLRPIEVHDLICKIGEIVVVGGVRRSALISLGDLTDVDMRMAKSGAWWEANAHRALANNSAVYESKPSPQVFLDEWAALVASGSGERGIFSRYGAQKKAAANGRRDAEQVVGTNPCAEILLRNAGLCNLSEVVLRPEDDSLEVIKEKVRFAVLLGTLQSTLTDFPYVRKIWEKNAREEHLLGVSLTGIQDCGLFNHSSRAYVRNALTQLRKYAVECNKEFAELLGIPPSAAITTVKPSGTVSQLVMSGSGIHGWFSKYYIRALRQSNTDPMTEFLKALGVPNEPALGSESRTTVFYFPCKSAEGGTIAGDLSAIDQLEMWKDFQECWSEHSVSVTVYVKNHEWMEVAAWVYKNFDIITGVSFLPYSEHVYKQAPYTACDEQQYLRAAAEMPESIDWELLSSFEQEDNTEGAQTLACTAGVCEI